MHLYDNSGEDQLGWSTSTTDTESVTAHGPGTFLVRVYGYEGAQASYGLSLQ